MLQPKAHRLLTFSQLPHFTNTKHSQAPKQLLCNLLENNPIRCTWVHMNYSQAWFKTCPRFSDDQRNSQAMTGILHQPCIIKQAHQSRSVCGRFHLCTPILSQFPHFSFYSWHLLPFPQLPHFQLLVSAAPPTSTTWWFTVGPIPTRAFSWT